MVITNLVYNTGKVVTQRSAGCQSRDV